MDDGVLESARAIRPYLEDLVGPGAHELDERIAGLLAAAARGEDVSTDLWTLLESDEATSAFLEAVLADAPVYRPPAVQPDFRRRSDRTYQPLAGDVAPVMHAGKFACPRGDYVWYRPAVGVPVPSCPTHGLRLGPR
jgi:hypothetical protein